MSTQELVQALKAVPEKRLRLFSLAWQLVDAQGNLDQAAVLFHAAELELAIEEARAYSAGTRNLAGAVLQCVRRTPSQ